MKKTLFLAFALIASVLVCTSCKKDKKNDPSIDSPIVGTWFYSEEASDYFYTFKADGTYQRIEDYYMNGRFVVAHEHIVGDGTFTLDGDIVTAKINSTLVYMDGAKEGDLFGEFWPETEKMRFSVKNDQLTLVHEYDTEDSWYEVLSKQ